MSSAKGGSDFKGAGKRKRDIDRNSAGTKNKLNGDSKTTLGSMLKYMEGYEVIVELKTGKRHRGRLSSADDNMNIMLEEQKDEEEQGGPKTKETGNNKSDDGHASDIAHSSASIPLPRNIRGSKIRYIHFPDNANLPMLVRSGRERERNAAKKYQKTKRSTK